MLWVLKRTVSIPKQMLKLIDKKIFTIFAAKYIYNFLPICTFVKGTVIPDKETFFSIKL